MCVSVCICELDCDDVNDDDYHREIVIPMKNLVSSWHPVNGSRTNTEPGVNAMSCYHSNNYTEPSTYLISPWSYLL